MVHASGATRNGRHRPYIRDDIRAVMATAKALGVSEYQLFERAWASQFGESAVDEELKDVYAGYLFRAQIPDWVSRHVLLNRAAVIAAAATAAAPSRPALDRPVGPPFAAAAVCAAALVGVLAKLAVA